MANPAVFMSHSTEDREILARLASHFEHRTNGVVAFFLSGQDIDAGAAWETEVLSQLSKSHLVFAFFSAEALQSHRVLFESGFARGRDLPVVPIGLPGIDCGTIPKPIGSLQGINLHSPEGLTQLLESLNRNLRHRHPTNASPEEFRFIMEGNTSQKGQCSVSCPTAVETQHDAL